MQRKPYAHRIAATLVCLCALAVSTPSGAVAESEPALSRAELEEIRAELLAAATAHNVALLVEADIANDGEEIDESFIAKLVDAELPIGRENAEKWVASLDDSALRMAGIIRADHCMGPKYGCRELGSCVFGGKRSSCLITGCGDGACKACWEIFGNLRKLAVKGWCSYTCQQGTAIVGVKLILQVRIAGELSACLAL